MKFLQISYTLVISLGIKSTEQLLRQNEGYQKSKKIFEAPKEPIIEKSDLWTFSGAFFDPFFGTTIAIASSVDNLSQNVK